MVLWKNNFELSLEGNEIFLGPLQHFLGRAHFLPQPIINQKAREKKNRGKPHAGIEPGNFLFK